MNFNQEFWRKKVKTSQLLQHGGVNHTARVLACVDAHCINGKNVGVDAGNAFCLLFSCEEHSKRKAENKYIFDTTFLEC